MKRFKEMFEDAPVNATGDAVATNEPIVRKKKKKEDSSGREIGTPELLKRYKEDTPGEMSEGVINPKILKKLKSVKGLSKKGAEMVAQLPIPVINVMINHSQKRLCGKIFQTINNITNKTHIIALS